MIAIVHPHCKVIELVLHESLGRGLLRDLREKEGSVLKLLSFDHFVELL